jgi:tetratricopeptide (TPR) repeat protein
MQVRDSDQRDGANVATREDAVPEEATDAADDAGLDDVTAYVPGVHMIAALGVCGIVVFAVGVLAGLRTSRVPLSLLPSRLARTISPRHKASAGASRLPVIGTPLERLEALDAIILENPDGDAAVLPRLVERARLLLFEAHAPMLALRDLERVGAYPQSDETAEALFLRVVAFSKSGALQRSIDDAHDFFRLFPRSWRTPDVLAVASVILAHTGRESEAIAVIENVMARDPRRADRQDLDTGLRGRFPPRLELAILRLGSLYQASGDRVAAEGAFALITRPVLGPDDFGECYFVSPRFATAEVRWCRAVRRAGDARAVEVDRRLESIAAGDDPAAARQARMVLGRDEAVPGERAAACVEIGGNAGLSAAARSVGPMDSSMASIVLESAAGWAYAAPHEVAALLARMDARRLGGDNAALHAIALSRVYEALGRIGDANSALETVQGERTLLARADLALRYPGEVAPARIAAGAERASPFVREIVRRGALR